MTDHWTDDEHHVINEAFHLRSNSLQTQRYDLVERIKKDQETLAAVMKEIELHQSVLDRVKRGWKAT